MINLCEVLRMPQPVFSLHPLHSTTVTDTLSSSQTLPTQIFLCHNFLVRKPLSVWAEFLKAVSAAVINRYET